MFIAGVPGFFLPVPFGSSLPVVADWHTPELLKPSAVHEEGAQLSSLSNAVSGQLFLRINLNFLYLHSPVQDVTPLLEIGMVRFAQQRAAVPVQKAGCFASKVAQLLWQVISPGP